MRRGCHGTPFAYSQPNTSQPMDRKNDPTLYTCTSPISQSSPLYICNASRSGRSGAVPPYLDLRERRTCVAPSTCTKPQHHNSAPNLLPPGFGIEPPHSIPPSFRPTEFDSVGHQVSPVKRKYHRHVYVCGGSPRMSRPLFTATAHSHLMGPSELRVDRRSVLVPSASCTEVHSALHRNSLAEGVMTAGITLKIGDT